MLIHIGVTAAMKPPKTMRIEAIPNMIYYIALVFCLDPSWRHKGCRKCCVFLILYDVCSVWHEGLKSLTLRVHAIL